MFTIYSYRRMNNLSRRNGIVPKKFDDALREVKDLLLGLGRLVEISLSNAVRSLENQDLELAEKVVKDDKAINRLNSQIDDVVTKLIATQQPVAKDLRILIAAMKISSDLERMGDLAVNIAQATVQLKTIEKLSMDRDALQGIVKMASITQIMVNNGINSYIDGNIELARTLAQQDDQVDELYELVIKNLISTVPNHPEQIEMVLKLSFVARYIERIADHTTNIAESILYIETGEQFDLN